jgi:hypothetical protein
MLGSRSQSSLKEGEYLRIDFKTCKNIPVLRRQYPDYYVDRNDMQCSITKSLLDADLLKPVILNTFSVLNTSMS